MPFEFASVEVYGVDGFIISGRKDSVSGDDGSGGEVSGDRFSGRVAPFEVAGGLVEVVDSPSDGNNHLVANELGSSAWGESSGFGPSPS